MDRNDSGQFAERVTPERVLDVIRSNDTPVTTTNEVAKTLDCTTETARRKLNALADEGRVRGKTIPPKTVVWWVSEGQDRKTTAEPLRGLVGLLDEGEAAHARKRSREWGEEFDRQMAPDRDDERPDVGGV